MNTENGKYVQMREYSRVDATIPIEIRLVPVEERCSLRSRTSVQSVLTEVQPLPEVEDKALSECVKIINSKLDTIIGLLTFQTREFCSLQLRPVNISAGGVRAVLLEGYEAGGVAEVKMMFPTFPYIVFYVYGEVVRSEKTENGKYETSIEFTGMDEDIRDKIAKFVFEKQREVLRMKRRQ